MTDKQLRILLQERADGFLTFPELKLILERDNVGSWQLIRVTLIHLLGPLFVWIIAIGVVLYWVLYFCGFWN